MDERLLFDKFHEALDVDPRPAAYERLRSALIAKTSTPRRRAAFQKRWTRMGFRLAAAIVLVAVAVTAGAVFFATHRVADNNVPAGLDANTVAYQKMMSADNERLGASSSNHCGQITDTGCAAAVERVNTALRQWLADLSASQTPAQFAIADAQMRVHLSAAIEDLNFAAAAVSSQQPDVLSAAMAAALDEWGWIDNMVTAITTRHVVPKSDYVGFVGSERNALAGCTDCQNVVRVTQNPCPGSSISVCKSLTSTLSELESELQGFEVGLVKYAPPNTERQAAAKLLSDLAAADTALVDMTTASLSGDWSKFDASRVVLGAALASIDLDSTVVIRG